MRERQREGGTGRESMRVCSVINHTRIVSFFSNFRLPDNTHHEHIVSSHFFSNDRRQADDARQANSMATGPRGGARLSHRNFPSEVSGGYMEGGRRWWRRGEGAGAT